MGTKPVETVKVVTEEGSEDKKISTLYDTVLTGTTVADSNTDESQTNPEETTEDSSEETVDEKPTEENPSVVVYIPSMEGHFASYNPDYILRKFADSKEIKILLPTESGTMARIEDIESHEYSGYVKKKDLKEALEDAVASDVPDSGYTMEDIRKSYNKLLQSLRNLIKEY
jgi:hypothetical protein